MNEPEPSIRYFGYPRAVEGPHVPYEKQKDENPVLSGTLLIVSAWLVSKLYFLQALLWGNAGFSRLRSIKHLHLYPERWDPTVIPISNPSSQAPKLDPESFPIPPKNLPGRYRTVPEYHALYMSGKLTPLAIAESLLPLIRRDANPRSHHSISFIDSHPDIILEAAKASTLRYQNGTPLSILDGVPTAVKDEVDLAGYRTTMGRRKNDRIFPIATESMWPIQKWEEAGVIIIGKTSMHELGADTTNNNYNWETPRNPHNSQYYTGGSSGGSAYAVAAGLVPFALGNDGGGSIRIPASNCGIYGLKTSHKRLADNGSTVTCAGPLASTISDLEAAYRIMAIPNLSDPTCSLFMAPGTFTTPRPKILGIYKTWFDQSDHAVLNVCNKAVEYFKNDLGYKIVPIEIPYLPEGQLAHVFTILSEMVAVARRIPSSESDWLADLSPANKVLFGIGTQTPAQDYALGQRMRNLLMQHLAFLFRKHPGMLIVTPTTPVPGWPIAHEGDLKYGFTDGNSSIRNMTYAWFANFSGCPAISCPVGYVDPVKGEGRIPVGLMAMGEWGSEDSLIEWGKGAEKWLTEKYPGGRQRPANWEDAVVLAKEIMDSNSTK